DCHSRKTMPVGSGQRLEVVYWLLDTDHHGGRDARQVDVSPYNELPDTRIIKLRNKLVAVIPFATNGEEHRSLGEDKFSAVDQKVVNGHILTQLEHFAPGNILDLGKKHRNPA